MSELDLPAPDWFQRLAHSAGPPRTTGMIKTLPADFEVREELGFEPEGKGDHVLLLIRKEQYNTAEVGRLLAQFAAVPLVDIGYCGLKDRNAVAYQWFSVRLAGRNAPLWSDFDSPRIRVIEATRHRRKLKRGAHHSNWFCIVVRQLRGDLAWLKQRLPQVSRQGVPNYFGEQRFGSDNLSRAFALFSGAKPTRNRQRRGFYLSAARSFLFNQILSARVQDGSWNKLLPGEAVLLGGSRSYFQYSGEETGLAQRLRCFDVHPSGARWGAGARPVSDMASQVEDSAVNAYPLLLQGLARVGMKQERRALRVHVQELRWEFDSHDTLKLNMRLDRGVYATAVLRECVSSPTSNPLVASAV
ncbi:MAG: tRNA pseudouridine(13) synthase TruD [Gammaproteobacteria bacterium]|nr:tRNA pseudouridine(13) synthase TruD [Gammaproteobacteria bacterium]